MPAARRNRSSRSTAKSVMVLSFFASPAWGAAAALGDDSGNDKHQVRNIQARNM
jgi:hypothetical protein